MDLAACMFPIMWGIQERWVIQYIIDFSCDIWCWQCYSLSSLRKQKQDLQPHKEVASRVVSMPPKVMSLAPIRAVVAQAVCLPEKLGLLLYILQVLFTRQTTLKPNRDRTAGILPAAWMKYWRGPGAASPLSPERGFPPAPLIQPHRAREDLHRWMAGSPQIALPLFF